MAGFTEAALEKKLSELNNSQQSIQTLSLWLIHHRKHHKAIVQVWSRELKKIRPSRKLTFIYLANDVIQNSKKKGPEFAKEFGTVLAKAFHHVALDTDEKTLKGLERVLTVWEQRNVYDKTLITEFRLAVDEGSKRSTTTAVAPPEVQPAKKRKVETTPVIKEEPDEASRSPPREPPDTADKTLLQPEELAKALLDLEHSAFTDAVVREKIASLPPEVSDVSLLGKVADRDAGGRLAKQVEDACTLLDNYNNRLSQELEDRKQVAKLLRAFKEGQQGLLAQAEEKLESFRGKLRKVLQVRSELKSHLQNLPDLTLLPNVTGGLAPLPSAGDLFSQH